MTCTIEKLTLQREWRQKNKKLLNEKRRQRYAESAERRERLKAASRAYLEKNRDKKLAYDRGRYETRRPEVMLWHARRRANNLGQICTISISDIKIPDVCPYLGIPFTKRGDYVPTLDRIHPKLGYVPGNVLIVTKRANRIKNDATWQELLKIGNALKQLATQP